MGTKYLQRKNAAVCPIHVAIKEECSKRLAESGFFSKDAVLDELNFSAIGDAVRWDYVREFIEGEQRCELVPLAEAFFKRHSAMAVQTDPAKFIASGNGKKTKGFANVEVAGGALAICRLNWKHKLSNGVADALQRYTKALHKRKVLEATEKLAIEDKKKAA